MAKKKYTKDSQGYYQTRVWDGTYDDLGRKKRITLRSKKSSRDLEQKVEAFRRQVEEGKVVKRNDITFLEYAREWAKVYKATKSLGTQNMYRNIIEKHFYALEGIKLSNIERIHFQLLLNNADGKAKTQQQILLTFGQIMRSAASDQLISPNIVDNILSNVDSVRYSPSEKRVLTSYEKDALFKANLSARDKAFICVLYGCGLRRGEALALQRFNISAEQRILTVRQAIAFDGNNPYIKETKTKNGVRTVPIPDKVYPYIMSYAENLRRETLFTMADGSWVTKSSYDKMWARIIREMNKVSAHPIQGLTAHVFRHNYCTNLCYQIPTISIKKIAELLGDTEKMVIEVYNHIILEKENPEEAVENALNF